MVNAVLVRLGIATGLIGLVHLAFPRKADAWRSRMASEGRWSVYSPVYPSQAIGIGLFGSGALLVWLAFM